MSSQKLRKLCENKSLKIEKCRKPGYWMVSFSERPNTEQFFSFKKDINTIGYDYTSDGSDSEGYYLVIGKKK